MRHGDIVYSLIKYTIALSQKHSPLSFNAFLHGYKQLLSVYKTDYILIVFYSVFYLTIIQNSEVTELTLVLTEIHKTFLDINLIY